MRYLTDIDMSQNEVRNAVFHPAFEEPKNPKVGQIYTDISGDTAVLKMFNGKKWVSLGASAPEKIPDKVEPSVTLYVSDVDADGMEVGSTIPITYTAELRPGSYTYGPDTGVVAESWRVYDTNGNSSTTPTGTFDDVIVGDDTDYKLTVEVTHSAGTIPVTDQGTPYPASQILAGTKSVSTSSIAGFRKYFYGTFVGTFHDSMTSNVIRELTHSTKAIGSGTSFDLRIPEGASQVVIAFPSESGLSLTEVIDTGAFNINVYDIFEKVSVDVEGANGYEAISYDVYVYTPDLELGANTYKVTIS